MLSCVFSPGNTWRSLAIHTGFGPVVALVLYAQNAMVLSCLFTWLYYIEFLYNPLE